MPETALSMARTFIFPSLNGTAKIPFTLVTAAAPIVELPKVFRAPLVKPEPNVPLNARFPLLLVASDFSFFAQLTLIKKWPKKL